MGKAVMSCDPGSQPSIEDQPEFAQFLILLAWDALSEPASVGDVGELTSGDAELFHDVRID